LVIDVLEILNHSKRISTKVKEIIMRPADTYQCIVSLRRTLVLYIFIAAVI
jgi:hypothetical protein